MHFKQVLALAIVTLGVAATAQADVVTNKPEYAYATEKAGTGTYTLRITLRWNGSSYQQRFFINRQNKPQGVQ